MKTITKLSKLETTGVAIVTRGANKRRFALTKSAEGGMQLQDLFVEILKGDGEYDPAEIDKMCQAHGLNPQGTETFKAILKLANAFKGDDSMRAALTESLPKALGFAASEEKPAPQEQEQQTETPAAEASDEESPPMVGDEEEEAEMPKEENKKPADGVQKSEVTPQAVNTSDISKLEAVLKSQETVIKSLEARAEVAEAAMKKLADENRMASWISKAEKELAFVPGKTAHELATLLKSLEDVSAETADAQFKMMKSVSDAMQKSELFKSVGHTKDEDKSAEAIVKSIHEKATGSELEKARAVVAEMEKNGALYGQYKEELRRKSRQ